MQLETDGQTPGRAQGAGAMMGLLRKGMFVGIGLLLLMPQAKTAKGYAMPTQNACRLSVVYNNVPLKAGLQTAWGFACIVELPDRIVLFDTGGNGSVLLSNMKAMGFSPEEVDAVVLSHLHGDHTGGLGAFLAENPQVTVYMPVVFPESLKTELLSLGTRVVSVDGPQKLFDGVYSTGVMGREIQEQALILDTGPGCVLLTGCAHPNVAAMAEQARDVMGKDIVLLLGGFHLGGSSQAEIHSVCTRLQALGVQKIAPSHCTGEQAIRVFRQKWGKDFIQGGLGARVNVPQGVSSD